MGTLTDYSENLILTHIFNSSQTAPTTVYIALCTADPTDAATGASMNEVANSNGYARKAITFGAAASRRVTQSGDVTFDAVTGAGYTCSYWALVSSGTHGAGNVLAHGALSTSETFVAGNTPKIASGQAYVELPNTGNFSDYLANKVLDWLFRNQAFTKPSTYVGYTTVIPTVSSTGSTITEPSNGYARVQVNVNGGSSPTWTTVSAGALDNTHAINFPDATGSQGTIVSMVICDASTSGNLLMFGDITDQAVNSGDSISFAIGALDISIS